jgi:hypothetical protein
MKSLTASQVEACAVERLGLDPTAVDFQSREALAALIRHTASIRCPCTERELTRTVTRLLEPLASASTVLNERVSNAIDGVVSYGDLIEISDGRGAEAGQVLALAAPSVARISPGALLLVGLRTGGPNSLPVQVEGQITLRGYARIIEVPDSLAALSWLQSTGFVIITQNEWNDAPEVMPADQLVGKYGRLFKEGSNVGTLDGLELLTSESNVTYYRGRWREAKKHSGTFVARRSRQYGSDAWCFVKLDLGRPIGLVDLPTPNYRYRPCDEAWHLQQALDFVADNPQRYRLRPIADRKLVAFDLFSPVPQWAHRRWNALGEQVEQRGALFSYLFNQEYLTQEVAFAESRMWLRPI